jgi:hypothetical protein
MDEAFRKVKGPKDSKTIWCPCRKCGNSRKRTKKKVLKQRGRLVRNLNDLYQDEAQGFGMMRTVLRSPSVVPSGSSRATGSKSAPSPVAEEEEEEEEGWGRRGRRSICEVIRHFRSDPYYQ